MPINPNIALGVQQQQPVNMLGQMGQMMALKAASQEMQSNEDMRNLFAGGANFDDPEFQKRGYMASPKAFQELLGKRATTQKTELEVIANDIKLRRDALTNVNSNEDYLKWHDGNHVGRTGAYFKSIGINPSRESIIAQLNQPGGLEKLKRASALGATELQKQLMQTERTRISAGPGYMQANLAREQYDDKLKYGGDVVTTTVPDPENPGQRIEIQTRRNIRGADLIPLEVRPMPLRVDISPNSATSSYQPSGAGGTPNVLATQVAPQSGGAAVPIVNGLNPNAPQQQAPAGATFAMPKSKSENLTEAQGKATNFSIRAKQAHEVLNSVGEGGKVQPGLIKRGAEAIPFIGEGLGTALNITQSDAQQQVEQAQRNFVNAVLRQESGAAINEGEFNNAKKQYFPQPGDSAAVIEQKRLNREAAIKGFDIAAGPGAKQATPPSTAPKRINSMDEYNSLPSGATYIDPEGTTRRKK